MSPLPMGLCFCAERASAQSGDHQMGLAFALRQTRDRLPEAEILSSERGQGRREGRVPIEV